MAKGGGGGNPRFTFVPKPFEPEPDHPLAAEHAAVLAYVDAAIGNGSPGPLERALHAHAPGAALLAAKPPAARRLVLAALEQARHWDRETARLWADPEAANADYGSAEWSPFQVIWARRGYAMLVIATLGARALPFEEADVVALLDWCGAVPQHDNPSNRPLKVVAKAAERLAKSRGANQPLRAALSRFADRMRATNLSEAKQVAAVAERLAGAAAATPAKSETPAAPATPATSETPAVAPTAPPSADVERLIADYAVQSAGANSPAAKLATPAAKAIRNLPEPLRAAAVRRLVREIVAVAKPDDSHNDFWMIASMSEVPGRLVTLLRSLIKSPLPYTAEDLAEVFDQLRLMQSSGNVSERDPTPHFAEAAERLLGPAGSPAGPLREALTRMGIGLSKAGGSGRGRVAVRILALLERPPADGSTPAAAGQPAPGAAAAAKAPARQPAPAAAGSPLVLVRLKQHLHLLPPDGVASEEVGLDRFPLRADSPLRAEHALLSDCVAAAVNPDGTDRGPRLDETAAWQALFARFGRDPGPVLCAAAERSANQLLPEPSAVDYRIDQCRSAATRAFRRLLTDLAAPLPREALFDVLLYLSAHPEWQALASSDKLLELIGTVREAAGGGGAFADAERYVLHRLRTSLVPAPLLGQMPHERVTRLTELVGDDAQFFLAPGEAWTDALNADLAATSGANREAWVALLRHAITATAARPTPKWNKAASDLLAKVGAGTFAAQLARWMRAVPAGRSVRILGHSYSNADVNAIVHAENATVLRGLVWMAPLAATPNSRGGKEATANAAGADTARALGGLAASAYRKVPGVGPRAVKVGNAAVYAIGQIPGDVALGQLAMLKVRVKFGTARKEVEKAFDAMAGALGLPREEIEEMGVPSYGLEEVGLRREMFGDFTAELRVEGRDAEIAWTRAADGKAVKSVPAKVKAEFKEELKDLRQSCEDVAAMLPAQAERIDSMFLLQKRWTLPAWRERYLDHPLVGTVARRLIWTFTHAGEERAAVCLDGCLVDAGDGPVEPAVGAEVRLWHPIGRAVEDVLAWRAWLGRHEVRQPFKQAHREVYLLTDAERATRTYSNRFAAHVIRQHQFNALCAARGWRNRLRLMVDDTYPPATKELPAFGLRAEYWVEGIGDDYRADTTDAGTYLRLSTDQVRFYRTGAAENLAHASGGGYERQGLRPGAGGANAPLPLERVPPLAFSEVMRDVDLFVGVASVGNDPTWQDGGPEGRYRAYWQSYSFGDLGATAQTRRQVLETLIPRLKIRDRAAIADRFLVVRGDLRTYKIHLGSGNILMEPNDQYLCIVPSRGAAAGRSPSGDLFLPFEGDATLSVILSKAFLLAGDATITDPTILSQIGR